MSWYIHPSKELCDDELPLELVLTNHDGSIVQAYVPCNASDQLKAENAKLRELVHDAVSLLDETCDTYYEIDYHSIVGRARELGVEVKA